MDNCLFCQIVSGQIPCYKVYEDELFFGFLDIKPLNPGHVLLIPKKHYRWTYDIPEFGKFFEVAKSISQTQIKVLNPLFVTFLTLGMLIPHAHLHIIPRFQDDAHKESIDTNHRIISSNDELNSMALSLSSDPVNFK